MYGINFGAIHKKNPFHNSSDEFEIGQDSDRN